MACIKAASPSLSRRLDTWSNPCHYEKSRKYSGLASLRYISAVADCGICINGSTVRRYRQRCNTTFCFAGSSHRPLQSTNSKSLVNSSSLDPSSNTDSESSPNKHVQKRVQYSEKESNDPIGGRFLFHPFRGGKVLSRSIKSLVSETDSGARWSDPGYVYPSLVRGRTAGAVNLTGNATKSQGLGKEGLTKGSLDLVSTGAGRPGLRRGLGLEEGGSDQISTGAGRDGLRSQLGTVETEEGAPGNGSSLEGLRGATREVREWGLEEVEGPDDFFQRKGRSRPPVREAERTVVEWEPYSFSQEGSSPEGPMDLLEVAEGLLGGRQEPPPDSKWGLGALSASAREGNRKGGSLSEDEGLDYSSRANEASCNPPSTSYSRSDRHFGSSSRLKVARDAREEHGRESHKDGFVNGSENAAKSAGENLGGPSEGGLHSKTHGRSRDVWKRGGNTSLSADLKPSGRAENPQGGVGAKVSGSADIEAGIETGLGADSRLRVGLETGLQTGSGEEKRVSALDDELGRFVQRLSKVGLNSGVSDSSVEAQSKTLAPNPVSDSQSFQSLNPERNLFSGSGLEVNAPCFGNPENPTIAEEPIPQSACSLTTRPLVGKSEIETEPVSFGNHGLNIGNHGLKQAKTQGSERSGRHELERGGNRRLGGAENRTLQLGEQSVLNRAVQGELGGAESEGLRTAPGGELEWAEIGAQPATAGGELERAENEAQPGTVRGDLERAENEAQPARAGGQLEWAETGDLPASAFYDENFLERFRYTRPPPNPNLPLFMDIKGHWTAPEDPMPPPFYPKNCTHEKSGPLPGYPHGRVPRPKPPGPLLHGKRPDFWVVNSNNNRLVVPRTIKAAPRGKLPGVRKLLEGWTGRGCMTLEESLGAPLTETEVAELIDGAVRERKEVYLGRDGLTWNMVQLIHTHWRRRPVCKIKCKGIYTVDMPKIVRELERCAGGRVIWQHGGTVLLFRGRNYHWKQPPVLELPVDRSAEKKLTQADNPMEDRNPGGMGKWESLQLSKRMNREDPVVWLDKNGYYGGLVHRLRTFFSAPQNDLAVIKCPGFVTGDVVKLALQLKELVPATVFQCDKERKQRIVLYRNPDWRCPDDEFTRLAETDLRPTYNPKPLTPKPKLRRTVMYEELAAVAAGEEEEGVWGRWSGLFEPPNDERGFGSNTELGMEH